MCGVDGDGEYIPQTLLSQDLLLQALHLACQPRVITLQLLVLRHLHRVYDSCHAEPDLNQADRAESAEVSRIDLHEISVRHPHDILHEAKWHITASGSISKVAMRSVQGGKKFVVWS